MDPFPDGNYVRLRSRVHGTYLHADEDGVGVSLSRRGASLNTAWQAHRVVRCGATYLLLHSAAHGRYLALSPQQAPPGYRAIQVVYSAQDQEDVVWVAIKGKAAHGDDDVLLRHVSSNRLLRVCGRYRFWYTGVSVDHYRKRRLRSKMMHWVVETIPPRPAMPVLHGPIQTHLRRFFGGLFRWSAELLQAINSRQVPPVLPGSIPTHPRGLSGGLFSWSVELLQATITRQVPPVLPDRTLIDNSGILDPRVVNFFVVKGMPEALIDYMDSIPGSTDDENCSFIRSLIISPLEQLIMDQGEVDLEVLHILLTDLARKAKSYAENSRLSVPQISGYLSSLIPTPALGHSAPLNERSSSDSVPATVLTPLLSNSDDALITVEVQEVLQDEYSPQEHEAPSPQLELEMTSFKVLASNAHGGVLLLHKPGLEQMVPPPQGSLQGTTSENLSDITATPAVDMTEKVRGPEKIQQEDGKHRTVSAAGEVLGEHPSIGINTAEEQVWDSEFALNNARMEESEIEVKFQNLQQQMRNVHQELTKEEKREVLKELKALKTELYKKKHLCSTLEEEAHSARVVYQREILRYQNI